MMMKYKRAAAPTEEDRHSSRIGSGESQNGYGHLVACGRNARALSELPIPCDQPRFQAILSCRV
jgi:hypothetical protein